MRTLSLLALCALVGCGGSAASQDASGTTQQDWVVKESFDRAYAVVSGVDYLPFEYKIDGCYARALYMSMELASKSMESNAVFAFAQGGRSLVVGPVQWRYHVAPMLEVGPDAQHLVDMVIDPSLSNQPLTEAEWLARMGIDDTTPDDEHPQMLIVPGSDYAPASAQADVVHANHDTPDFAHLPPFRASDVQSACSVMYGYLAIEPGKSADQIASKQQKLVTRSTELVDALRGLGKLREDVVFDAAACAN